jgi:aminoglycoside phosphotransferase (APT) family kinase protein
MCSAVLIECFFGVAVIGQDLYPTSGVYPMTILTSQNNSVTDLRQRLETWARGLDLTGNPRVLSCEAASAVNGYSNETYCVRLTRAGETEMLVLRLPPGGPGLFPDYDIGRQYAFMSGLYDAPGVPMPRCRALEPDSSALGRPFLLVDYEKGQIPSDQPLYLNGGWVVEATDAERAKLWRGSVEALAALSKVRWSGERLAAVDWPDRNRSRTEQHLELFDRWAKWADHKFPLLDRPLMRELRVWLQRNRPNDEEPGVVWGDARPGNIIYRNFTPVALLDWELAAIGDPEFDISYLLIMQRFSENQSKSENQLTTDSKTPQRIGGFMSDADTIEHYNQRAFRPVRHYRYYWLLNAYKIYCMVQCFGSLLFSVAAIGMDDVEGVRKLPYLWDDVDMVFGSSAHSALF